MADIFDPWMPAYRLDGFEPASPAVERDFSWATLVDDMLLPLAEHHSGDGRDTFLLFHDRAAIWDPPGAPEYVAFHLTRDLQQRTFEFAYERAPVVPLAQNWLIRRGCPPEATAPTRVVGPHPADRLTSRLEHLLRTNSDGRYEVIDHHTDNSGSFDVGTEVRVLVHDHHPDSASAPYRLFVEETDSDYRSYTVREGAFPSAAAAHAWITHRNTPLPLPPASVAESTVVHSTDAARLRSPLSEAAGPALPTPHAIRPGSERTAVQPSSASPAAQERSRRQR